MVDFSKYEEIAQRLDKNAESLWKRATFITVADILAGDVDLGLLNDKYWELTRLVSDSMKSLNAQIDKIPEDEYWGEIEDEHNRVGDLFSKVEKKIDLVDSVISGLRRIEEDIEESETASLFKGESDLTLESQNWLSLKRL
jgi:hypothetical protein